MTRKERVEDIAAQLDRMRAREIDLLDAIEYILEVLIDMNTTQRETFKPPTPEEVTAYGKEIGYRINGESFCCSYAQKGWMVGQNKMKDWKAAVRNWKTNKWGEAPEVVDGGPPERTKVTTTAKEVAELFGDYYEESST